MDVTASPKSRFGLPGATLRYRIQARGAEFLVLSPPASDRLDAHLEHVRRAAEGIEAELIVRVRAPGLD